MRPVRAAFLSDVGRARDLNEDAAYVGRSVFAVADGLGGHNAGEVASHLALDSIAALDQMDPRKAASHVADAVRRGNKAVYDRSQGNDELKGMGTTITAVAIHEGIAHIAHVGDSRCYLIRGPHISQLSHDHTLVARMVNEGRLTSEQAEVHPQRSILTRALGADRDVDVEELNVPLVKGDRLILCSDGLSGVLAPDEIRALAGDGADLDEICKALIDEANERGGPDNITAVVVEVEEGAALGHRKHVARPARAGHTRRVPLRPFVWAAIVIGIVAGGYYGVRAWADRSYYVGVQDGKVAIYRGLPVEVGPLVLSNVEEPTRFLVEDVKNPAVRRSLAEGIRAGSIEDARRIVAEQIAPYVAVTPPKASPSPSTTRKKR